MSELVLNWDNYVGVDNEVSTPLLISSRSRELLLVALNRIDKRYCWKDALSDSSLWDEIENQLGETYNEVMKDNMPDFTPVGTIIAYPSTTAPDKWHYCDGATLLKSAYSELYDLIGDTFTVPPLATTFKLPDMRSKYIRGTNTGFGNSVGTGVGEDSHTLTIAEIPPHDHPIPHTHTVPIADNAGVQARVGRGTSTNIGTLTTSASSTPNSSSTGGGGAHENRPASMHFAWMIKVLP